MTIAVIGIKLLVIALAIGFAGAALTNWRPFRRSMPSKPPAPLPGPLAARTKEPAPYKNLVPYKEMVPYAPPPLPPTAGQLPRRRPTLVQSEEAGRERPVPPSPPSPPQRNAPLEPFDVAAFSRELDTLRSCLDQSVPSVLFHPKATRSDQHDADPSQISNYLNDALTSAVRLLGRDQRTSEHRGTAALIESNIDRYLKHSS